VLATCSRVPPRGIYSHSLPRHNPVRPAVLPASITSTDLSIGVDLYTAENVLRPRDATIIWWVPQVTDMYPAPVACTSRSALVIRAACAIVRL